MIGTTVHFTGRISILTLQILAFKNGFPTPSDTVGMYKYLSNLVFSVHTADKLQI